MSDADDEFLKCDCKECGNPIEFPASAAGETIECPHCHQWTELIAPEAEKAPGNLNSIALIVVLLILIGAGVAGIIHLLHTQSAPEAKQTASPVAKVEPTPAANIAPTNPTAPAVVQSAPKPVEHRPKSPADLKVGKVSIEKSEGSGLIYAIGEIENDSEYQRFNVRIDLDIISLRGAKIGSATDYKPTLEPHQTWHFRAMILDPSAVAAKVASVKEE